MTDISIKGISSTKVLEIVQELRDMGWEQGKDFDFSFYPSEYDYMNGNIIKKRTVFTFYNDTNASYFTLRFS